MEIESEVGGWRSSSREMDQRLFDGRCMFIRHWHTHACMGLQPCTIIGFEIEGGLWRAPPNHRLILTSSR